MPSFHKVCEKENSMKSYYLYINQDILKMSLCIENVKYTKKF